MVAGRRAIAHKIMSQTQADVAKVCNTWREVGTSLATLSTLSSSLRTQLDALARAHKLPNASLQESDSDSFVDNVGRGADPAGATVLSVERAARWSAHAAAIGALGAALHTASGALDSAIKLV